MSETHPLEGWETYPENLILHGSNAYGYDYQAYDEQLADDSERLFLLGDRIYVKIVEVGVRGA
jgi:hypothetical protein